MHEPPEIIPYETPGGVWMVPCLKDRTANEFQPLAKPDSSEIDWSRIQSRQPWLPAEDRALELIVKELGPRKWAKIAQLLNEQAHRSMPVRQGKQCRERYYNHIDHMLVKGHWTEYEDLYILEQQVKLGNRWSEISKMLRGRTENQVKNRFKSLLRMGNKISPDNPVQCVILQRQAELIKVPRPERVLSVTENFKLINGQI